MHLSRSTRSLLTLLVAGVLAAPVATRADFLSALNKFLHKDVDVITVTDVTAAGKAYAPATPDKPVRYMIVNMGYTPFGSTWAGETVPSNRAVLKWMMEAMRKEGYLLADELHPPEQVFIFAWGMLGAQSAEPSAKNLEDLQAGHGSLGSSHHALKFLGGDKVNLMWETQQAGGFVDPRVLLRGMIRTGVAGKVWDFSSSNLFLGAVRSFPAELLENPNAPLLWETRFACPSTGLRMDKAMPLLVTAAATRLGRETVKPVSINATRTFGGNVNLGELTVLENKDAETPPAEEPPPHAPSTK